MITCYAILAGLSFMTLWVATCHLLEIPKGMLLKSGNSVALVISSGLSAAMFGLCTALALDTLYLQAKAAGRYIVFQPHVPSQTCFVACVYILLLALGCWVLTPKETT